LQETETEEESPPFNIELESKEVMRASWKNEMETYTEKTISRILTKHFKKIRSGLNNLMDRIAALFRMITDTKEKNEEWRERKRPLELCSWQCAGLMCQIAWGSLSPRSRETPAKSSAADLNPVRYS
jgi:hypothetical protein